MEEHMHSAASEYNSHKAQEQTRHGQTGPRLSMHKSTLYSQHRPCTASSLTCRVTHKANAAGPVAL